MRKLTLFAIGAALLTSGFTVGIVVEHWRTNRDLIEHPCSVRVWQPSAGFVSATQDTRDCLLLGKQRTFEGVWVDSPYMEGGFRPASDGSVSIYGINADGILRAKLQWLANTQAPPTFFSGRRYRVKILGRVGHLDGSWIDGHENVIVVDDIVSASIVGAAPPKQ